MPDDEVLPPGVEREHTEESPTIDFSDVAKPLDRHHALLLKFLSPKLTKFQIPWANRYGMPLAVDCEIDAHALLRMIRVFLLETVRQKFGIDGWDFESFGKSEDPEWLQICEEAAEDDDFLKVEREAYYFFLRHYPVIATYAYMITIMMAQLSALGPFLFEGDSAVLGNMPEEKDKLLRSGLKGVLKSLEKEIKEIIGTRTAGGSTPKLDSDKRAALHLRYDYLHASAKTIRKQYKELLKRFEEGRQRSGYKYEEWQKFWTDTAAVMHPDEDRDFLAIFARRDTPSASKVAYLQLHKETGHKISYLPRLIRESRESAGKTSPQKEDNENL